ncbi:hypothetical protein MICAER10613_021620 [Microcystis aeruginosa]
MGVLGIGTIYFLSYYIISASPIRGSLILCVISLTDIRSDQSLCPLCLEWFVPLAHRRYRILEYILTTEPIRKDIFPLS